MNISRAQAAGLMAFWANIEPEHEQAFLQWHNCEHIPERVGIPGFVLGRRYRQVGDAGRFLMCYDTLGEQVLTSAAYLRALNNPTPRTRRALAWFRRPVRNVYALRWSVGPVREEAPPVVVAAPWDSGATTAPDAVEAAIGGVLGGPTRIARYGLDARGSGVRTHEAGIHGASSAQEGGMLWIECAELALLDEPAARDRLTHALQDGVGSGLGPLQVFWLDFALAAP